MNPINVRNLIVSLNVVYKTRTFDMDPSNPAYDEFIQWRDNAMRLLAEALARLHEQTMEPPPAPKIDRVKARSTHSIKPRSLASSFEDAA